MDNFDIVKNAGYQEMPIPAMWWVNYGFRMAFSEFAVKDADEKWLEEAVKEHAKSGEFRCYFAYGEKMDSAVCGRVMARVPEKGLVPDMRLIKPKQ